MFEINIRGNRFVEIESCELVNSNPDDNDDNEDIYLGSVKSYTRREIICVFGPTPENPDRAPIPYGDYEIVIKKKPINAKRRRCVCSRYREFKRVKVNFSDTFTITKIADSSSFEGGTDLTIEGTGFHPRHRRNNITVCHRPC